MQKIILKDITGNENLLYLDNEKNLIIKKNGSDSTIIFKNCSSEFDAILNEMGKMHIVLQDVSGNLYYLLHSEEKWINFSLLKSRNQSCNFENIKIFDIGGNINIFYTLKHAGRTLLIHHKIDLQNEKKPNVLDYVYDGKYSAFCDKKGNIYILYQNELKKLLCRVYNEYNGSYTPKMINVELDAENFCGVCGLDNNPYITYITREKTHYSVVFFNLKDNFKKTIGFGTDSIVVPFMHNLDNHIFISWKERFNCYKCYTKDFGNSFSKTNFLGKNTLNSVVKNCTSSFEYI